MGTSLLVLGTASSLAAGFSLDPHIRMCTDPPYPNTKSVRFVGTTDPAASYRTLDPYMAGARYQRLLRLRGTPCMAEGAHRSCPDKRERRQDPQKPMSFPRSPEHVERAPGLDPNAISAARSECSYTCAGLRQRMRC